MPPGQSSSVPCSLSPANYRWTVSPIHALLLVTGQGSDDGGPRPYREPIPENEEGQGRNEIGEEADDLQRRRRRPGAEHAGAKRPEVARFQQDRRQVEDP